MSTEKPPAPEKLPFEMPDFLSMAGLRGKKDDPRKIYATFNRRTIAMTIDSTILLLLAPILDSIFSAFYQEPNFDFLAVAQRAQSMGDEAAGQRYIVEQFMQSGALEYWMANSFWQGLVFCIFSGICWKLWSATPGKMLLRMKVVDAKTLEPLSDLQILMRLAGYMVTTVGLCIGFLWIGIDKRRQGLHDKLAESVVIRTDYVAKLRSQAADP